MEDQQQNPFFIHHSDHPALVFVSHLLTEENYPSWRRAMIIAIRAKNKIGFVDGSIQQPLGGDPQFQLLQRNDNVVASWLLNSVSKDLTASVIYASTAAAIWNDLQERFLQNNGPRLFQLRKDFITCTQGNLSVGAYYSKIKGLWEELAEFRPIHQCVCGGVNPLIEHIDREYVLTFLLGLNESFNLIRSQILLMDPFPSVSRVFSLVIQEEKQRVVNAITSENNENLAYAVTDSNGAKIKAGTKDRPLCSQCGVLGHIKDKCFKLHGYPPGFKKGKGSNSSQPNANAVHTDIREEDTPLKTKQYQ
ncbi:uncharacterized protein LOC131634587 [Vicia villosa]|uniref:uncharacterized protein LOC131634587 n=1 Tax=Vicia villosa TaxID=3911 RepID=UPI00273CBCED|nr:uncharacterized protein LOC131634587 [Vicia villosa]